MPKNVQTTTKLHSSHMLANNAQNSPSYASAVHELRNFLPRNKCLLISWLQSPSAGSITSWHIDGETIETARDFIFLGSKITADGDCSHEIKRRLLLERKPMTNVDSILKSRDRVKAMVFPVVMYGCKSWTIKKTEH